MSLPNEMNSRFAQYSRLLLRRRRLFYLAVGLPLLFTIVFTSIATPSYKAIGKLLPSSDASDMGVIGILTGFFGSRGTVSQEGAPSSFLYIDILKSSTVIESVFKKEVEYIDRKGRTVKGNLRELANYSKGTKGFEEFQKNNSAKMDLENGVITITTTANDPVLAALILNTWIEKLDEFNQNVRISQAGENLKYLEKRLEDSRAELAAANDSLIQFLANNRGYPNATNPKVEAEVRRLTNERSLKEQINELLAQEYEMALLTKRKNTPVVSVLDYASPPTEKAGPKRVPVFMLSFAFAILILFLILFILEANDPTPATTRIDLDELKSAYHQDLQDLKDFLRRKK